MACSSLRMVSMEYSLASRCCGSPTWATSFGIVSVSPVLRCRSGVPTSRFSGFGSRAPSTGVASEEEDDGDRSRTASLDASDDEPDDTRLLPAMLPSLLASSMGAAARRSGSLGERGPVAADNGWCHWGTRTNFRGARTCHGDCSPLTDDASRAACSFFKSVKWPAGATDGRR